VEKESKKPKYSSKKFQSTKATYIPFYASICHPISNIVPNRGEQVPRYEEIETPLYKKDKTNKKQKEREKQKQKQKQKQKEKRQQNSKKKIEANSLKRKQNEENVKHENPGEKKKKKPIKKREREKDETKTPTIAPVPFVPGIRQTLERARVHAKSQHHALHHNDSSKAKPACNFSSSSSLPNHNITTVHFTPRSTVCPISTKTHSIGATSNKSSISINLTTGITVYQCQAKSCNIKRKTLVPLPLEFCLISNEKSNDETIEQSTKKQKKDESAKTKTMDKTSTKIVDKIPQKVPKKPHTPDMTPLPTDTPPP
jgi:hypothetical protein